MNQVDWEKMKEAVSITDVESVTQSSWFTVQNEYVINNGTRTDGAYTDTTVVDNSFESFIEAGDSVSGNLTLIDAESFEGSWPPSGWSEWGAWNKRSNERYHGYYSAAFDGGSSGYLTTPNLDCSDAEAIYVDFWYRDGGSEAGEFLLQYYDGHGWNTIYDLGATWNEGEWLHYHEEVTNSQYFNSNFRIRWEMNTNYANDDVYVDLVTVTETSDTSSYSLDLDGVFALDLSTYPLAYIQTVTLQLRYRANDSAENWYLKAYNWTAAAYSDNGFNYTGGQTPTTEWNFYSANLTDEWQSYVNENGILYVKLVDQSSDSIPTSVDIDFLGVIARIDGTQFSFENKASLTVHLVSLWVINSTDHQHYDMNKLVNAAETRDYIRVDIPLPTGSYIIKVVTERGNTAVYSGTN